MQPDPDAAASAALVRKGLLLEYLTLGWNVLGTVVVIAAAFRARSVALAGFGLDSLIEILASTVVVWQLTGTGRDREKKALRLIGAAFLTLAVYILVQALRTLLTHARPDTSIAGIAWLALTVAAMLALALGKGRVGRRLGNAVLLTESRVTLVDAYLAASVLLGLVLNALLDWGWADPVAGLVIVYYGFAEGIHAWREGRE